MGHAGTEPEPARQRHWRHRMRVLVPAGTAVAAAGLTAALLGASAGRTPSALAAVTSALTKTSADSYRFSVDSTLRLRGREWDSDVVSGAFDPRHQLGTESLLTTTMAQRQERAQIRFIGQYVYTRVPPGSGLGKPWDKTRAAAGRSAEGLYGFVSDQPVSPAELFRVLRSAGPVSNEGRASGPGWTGTKYAFTAHLHGTREIINATVYIDQQGRVRRLVTITTQGPLTDYRDLTFGDFGVPVPATAPPASQAASTSAPYWGFYF
jgi:hypothetical protein